MFEASRQMKKMRGPQVKQKKNVFQSLRHNFTDYNTKKTEHLTNQKIFRKVGETKVF